MKRPDGRKKLGSIWIDTGTLLIADPCQVIPNRGEPPKIDYERVGEMHYEQGEEYVSSEALVVGGVELLPERHRRERAQCVRIESGPGILGAIVYTTGCDGYYPVFLECGKDGQPARIVIELGGKVEP